MKNEKEILKWLNNELTSEEIDDLKQSENSKTLEKIAHYASQLEAPEVDVQAALDAFYAQNQSKKKSKVRTFDLKPLYKIAAVFVVLLTTAYFLYFNGTTSFETQIAQTKTVLLPDNSEVILNATSKLSFNERKWSDKRELKLDGEAYFKVQKGQTFSVYSNSGIVKVLGTQFNIKERKNYFEVHCYEGLVSVTIDNKTIKLTQGKTFRVINGIIENVEDYNAKNPSWIENESSFNSIPLDQVIAELERQYNIKIKTEGVNTSKLFTGSFTNTNKEIALQAVTIPLQLSFRIQEKIVILYNYGVK
ncbi:FecR domain-containing protein [Flavobacterium sp.]|uniref:FecR family protein n=1 Tax=Flavobacterium sp. TaxID=239 RepID=UPI00286B8BBB|nr:FecR domain-containing protein [Flavobacterium sp.]